MEVFTLFASLIGVFALGYLVYYIFSSKKTDKINQNIIQNPLSGNGGILVVFSDKEKQIGDFPEISKLADWVYNDRLKGFEATNIKSKIVLSELRQIFKDSYGLDNKHVSVQSIAGTWGTMIS